MTDLEKLEKTFYEIGVNFKIETSLQELGIEVKTISYDGEVTYDTICKIQNGIGFYSFICEFYFLNGVYQNHGVWE